MTIKERTEFSLFNVGGEMVTLFDVVVVVDEGVVEVDDEDGNGNDVAEMLGTMTQQKWWKGHLGLYRKKEEHFN